MGEVRTRKASRPDLKRVYEIEKESFNDPYSQDFLEFLYDVHPGTFLVAERDGELVGYIIAPVERGMGHIFSIAVTSSERKKNIGTTLVNEVLKIFEATGITIVWLEVRKSNIEAQKFYESLGFIPSHTIDKYYRNEDALVYLKFLRKLAPNFPKSPVNSISTGILYTSG